MSGALLLLLLCLPVRGDEIPAQPAVPAPSAEDDLQAPPNETPSDRELRRMRRAERRAARRAARQAAGLPDDGRDDADATEAEKKGGAAVQKALDLGSSFKGAAKDPGGMGPSGAGQDPKAPGGTEKTAAAVDGAARPGPARPPADPSRPRTEAELVIAAQSGYKASPAAVGLVLTRDAFGTPALQRADGKPPTKQDLDALRRHIESEPRALMRRPDFFERVSRQRYGELKSDYRSKPELKTAAFKDVGLTAADRDFVWERSCDKVSGDCNPAARDGSYKKDAEVAPEDLDSIWKQIYGTADTLIKAALGTDQPVSGLSSAPGLHSRLLARLREGPGAFADWLSGRDPGEEDALAAGVDPAAAPAAGTAAKAGQDYIRLQAKAQEGMLQRAARARRRQAGAGTGLLAAGALLWLAWRRRPG